MSDRIKHFIFRSIAAAFLLPVLIFGLCSCSELVDVLESGLNEMYGNSETESTRHSKRDVESSDYTYVTLEPTGIYTEESEAQKAPDYDHVSSIYVYSVWYDPTEDNPAKSLKARSKDTFALKGVFYFSEPLTAVFDAKLFKGNELLLKRTVEMKDNITAEADFSAGLEGFGVFDEGIYRIELVYDGRSIAFTPDFEVY